MTIAGLTVVWTVGMVLLLRGWTALGVWLLVGPTLAAGFNVVLIRRVMSGQRAGAPRRRGAATGRVLAPQAASPSALGRDVTWTGGGTVATELGRMNATWPLAVLAVREGVLMLRFRPTLIVRMFGARTCIWQPGDLLAVYPVRGRLARFNRGLAFESTTMPLAYFWTWRPEPVLAVLGGHGVPVDWTERRIRLLA